MRQFRVASLFPINMEEALKKRTVKSKKPVYQEKKRKKHIPAALREAVWIHRMGRTFEGKCPTTWCKNTITVFDFQSGHDIPESKGGPTNLENLIPICSRCNLSMGNEYTFKEWCAISPTMAPKMMEDADGDIPPCSVMDSYEEAKVWDEWKQQKYKGKQKAKPLALELHPKKRSWIQKYFSCFLKS
jgi:hypothetical protein